jgi:hypothetical protein
MISLTPSDLNEFQSHYLSTFIESGSTVVATNVYSKFNRKFSLGKHLMYENNHKKIIILSVIADPNNPEKPFYISEYRIESPAYEINRINSSLRYDTEIIILHSDFSNKKQKEIKEYFKKFISPISRKPDYIIADINKNFSIKKTKVIGYYSDKADINFYNELNFFKRVESKKMASYSKKLILYDVDDIIKKTDKYFNKKISSADEDIPMYDGNNSPLGMIFAYGLSRFLRSDMVIFDNKLLKKGIEKGDITVKVVYSIIKNDDERFIYLKIRKENMESLNDYIKNLNVSIYSTINITGKTPQKNMIYRVLTTENFIKNNPQILNHINEFSILNVKMIDGILWYVRNHKLAPVKIEYEPAK